MSRDRPLARSERQSASKKLTKDCKIPLPDQSDQSSFEEQKMKTELQQEQAADAVSKRGDTD